MENTKPVYSKLNAAENGVLVCIKKEGPLELFKYLPLGKVLVTETKTLEQVIAALEEDNKKLRQIIEDQEKAFKKEIQAIRDNYVQIGQTIIAIREENQINETDPDY